MRFAATDIMLCKRWLSGKFHWLTFFFYLMERLKESKVTS